MSLDTVLEQYKEHAFRILFKAKKRRGVDSEGSSVLTSKERKGYAYYRTAIQTVQNLIDQDTLPTEGFKQYEYVPQHLRFSKETTNE
jgi:hypothetical protein